MSVPLLQVDAFTEKPFAGNPAAVCLLRAAHDDEWMQSVAAEMNLSETAFVHPRDDDDLSLRWFTPTVEVDLCGHATLAAAHALWETGRLGADAPARFHTRSGLLTARRDDEGVIELDFPATPPTEAPAPEGLLEALGVEDPRTVARTRFDYLVELASADAVRAVAPDFARLRAVETRGVMVTAASDDPAHHFVSRFFAPAVGVDEDPVTGSAHCALAQFWGARLEKDRLTGYQASARGGVVRLERCGERVRLGGRAVTVLRGELLA